MKPTRSTQDHIKNYMLISHDLRFPIPRHCRAVEHPTLQVVVQVVCDGPGVTHYAVHLPNMVALNTLETLVMVVGTGIILVEALLESSTHHSTGQAKETI